jgi:hypothetical protein
MQALSPNEPAYTFVVRLWIEWSQGSSFWRGSIEHLQSGKRIAFEDLETANAFIRSHLVIPYDGQPAGKKE